MATTATTKERPHVRWMIRRDMPEVLMIENSSFLNPYRWSESEFISALRQRNTIGLVAERDDAIVGFVIYELHRDHLFIDNLAVDPKSRLRGIGSTMHAKLASKLSPGRRTRIATMVSEENLGAQLFFRSRGYIATKVVKSPYEGSDLDGYAMEFRPNVTGE